VRYVGKLKARRTWRDYILATGTERADVPVQYERDYSYSGERYGGAQPDPKHPSEIVEATIEIDFQSRRASILL